MFLALGPNWVPWDAQVIPMGTTWEPVEAPWGARPMGGPASHQGPKIYTKISDPGFRAPTPPPPGVGVPPLGGRGGQQPTTYNLQLGTRPLFFSRRCSSPHPVGLGMDWVFNKICKDRIYKTSNFQPSVFRPTGSVS